ncbi:hypothetical protein ENUP19_0018G0074 [Entamoeba nuttalli]|uniref:Leucine-rich repeat containing protein n=2 Tax=Entamoeba nuttalli TaxID=412467 RepID=K2H4F9_ENTNP|nr:leucine-rich repeat containing protein [Entamoeba nuttalli P19]EKE37369.1 leucine-rich repeat containing protein [Entamoeba nuttalli P19]|eukprot:XP_008860299.1 leucine-rich repeat containing protein [Entamoeba nuttalli P19]
MTCKLERCFLLNIAFYFETVQDLITLSFVNHKCDLFDLFLKNPKFDNELELKNCLKYMKNLQTFEAPMIVLSRFHHLHRHVLRYISSVEEINSNVFSYLKFIKSQLIELNIVITETVSFKFEGFVNLKKLHINVACSLEEIKLDFSDLSHDSLIIFETLQYNINQLLPIIQTIKGKLVIKFSDIINEITIAKCRSAKRDIKFIGYRNDLYISLIKTTCVLEPIYYHLTFAIDFVGTEHFSKVFNNYLIPFIALYPSQIEHDSILLDLRDEEIYSLQILPEEFPQIQLLLPTVLLSLSIESPSVEIPLLPNLLELTLIHFQPNVLPQLPITLTLLNVIDCPHLSELEIPPQTKSLCLRSLSSLSCIHSLPDTIQFCFIEHCEVDIPLLLDVKELHLSDCLSIQEFPDTITRLFLSNINSPLPSLTHLSLLNELTLFSIPSLVELPSTLNKIIIKDSPNVLLSHPILSIAIPFGDTIPKLPLVYDLTINANTLNEIPESVTSLQLNGCVIEEHLIFPEFKNLLQLTLSRCILKKQFPLMTCLTYLNCNKTEPPPIGDSIKNLSLAFISLEQLQLPSSLTSLRLFRLNSLSNIRFNSSIEKLDVQYCSSLCPLNLPTTISELSFSNCANFVPLNTEELTNLPYGEQLFLKSFPRNQCFQLP